MDSLRGMTEVTSPSPLTSNVMIKCLTGTHVGVSRFPKLNECAHFHYEIVELGSLQASLCEEKPGNQEIKNYITTQPSDERSPSFCVSVTANGKAWIVRRSYDDFYMLDRQVHRCIYDRKFSQLPELPISEELFDYISSSEQVEIPEDGLRTMLMKYLDRFSILAGNLINCGPVLNWFELDNRGNRLLVPEESAINTPAVGAAYVIKRYSAQATDEISFEVGDMVSVIDMPPPEDSVWWRGKKGFQVGFFPCDCVEIISDRIPKTISIPKKAPTKPVLRKHGKLITFFRSFILTRPTRRKLKQRGILKERVFGCDLGEHLLNSGHDIPIVLKSCTEFIEEFGVVDGIYRLSGVTSNIQKLRVAFDEERVPDLQEEAILQDIHCVASLLKMYFRELPNPLLTYQLYDKFVSAVQSNDDVRLIKMRDVVHQLPPPHYRTLEYLIKHLSRVSAHGNNTGMGPKNIAIVWAPNLLRSKDLEGGSVAALHVVGVQAVLTEYLIRYSDLIFNEKMPMFSSNLSEDVSLNEHDTPRRTRPKSLAISTPTKLLSLEEARSRVLATSLTGPNSQVDSKYIEVGGGPSNLPAKYHTIIELPAGKRGSGKLKKSPMGWKAFFTKGRNLSGGSHREKSTNKSENLQFQHQLSMNTSFQERVVTENDLGFSQNKRLRTVKSAESLISSLDYSHDTSDVDETLSDCFKYSRLVSSRSRLSSDEPSESNDPIVDHLIMKSEPQDLNQEAPTVESQQTIGKEEKLGINEDAHEVEEVRNIKIEIGPERITESTTDNVIIKDIVGSRKDSVSSETSTGKYESTSPKSHKLSLKQKFKQAFTSPPSIRRVVQVADECPSPFKRNPASFREKIVKTFSPESLRKKQSASDANNANDEGSKFSPTAPPRRKQRKKANIEEDYDSSPEGYAEDEMMSEDEAVVQSEPHELVTSPDSMLDAEGVNETVTVEVHAVEGSPNDLSEFEFEKSFLSKSEKSLLEEVTSELAQKSSADRFSVFPVNTQSEYIDLPEKSENKQPNSVITEVDTNKESSDQVPNVNIDNDYCENVDVSVNPEITFEIKDDIQPALVDDDKKECISSNSVDPNSVDSEVNTIQSANVEPTSENVDSIFQQDMSSSPAKEESCSSVISAEKFVKDKITDIPDCIAEAAEKVKIAPNVTTNETENKSYDFDEKFDDVFEDVGDNPNFDFDSTEDGTERLNYQESDPSKLNTNTFDSETCGSGQELGLKEQYLSAVEDRLIKKLDIDEIGNKFSDFVLSYDEKMSPKTRINSWNFSNIVDSGYGTSPRERWSYPPPDRFSPLDDSKRKFESEIGREIVRDRRMKHELQQIQALNLKNKQNSNLNSPSSLVSSGKAIPFELHPLKPVSPADITVPEPAEADVAPIKSVGNLPELGARTGSVSSDKSIEEDTQNTSKVKSPTSPQKSMIPRMISPTKQTQVSARGLGNGLPVSPTRNNRESVELRKSRRANASTDQKNLRNSDPNGTAKSADKLSDHRSKRHSESEIMTKSFPPRTQKASVKELLNKFEKHPESEGKISSQNCHVKCSSTNENPLLIPVQELDSSVSKSSKEKSETSTQHRYSLSDVQRRKTAPKPRTRSADIISTPPQILENSDIIITDMLADKMSDKPEENPVLQRPTTLFDSDKVPKGSKEAVMSPCDSISSSNSAKDSPILSPCSPDSSSNHSLDGKSLLSSSDDANDSARRERINRYKEERRAQLREKIKIESSSLDEKTSPTKKSWKRSNSESSPTKSSLKKSGSRSPEKSSEASRVNKSEVFKTVSSPAVPESQRSKELNGDTISKITSPTTKNNANSTATGTCMTSAASSESADKEIVIVENIPTTIAKSASSHKQFTPPPSKPQPKGIRERMAMFEKEKGTASIGKSSYKC